MEDVMAVIKDLVRSKKALCDEAYENFNEVTNREHSISEMVKAKTEYDKAHGAYTTALDLLIKMYEMGLA